MKLALLCALLLLAGVTPAQGGFLNLNKMIMQVTEKVPPFYYWFYGCHCGLRSRGQPKDATDWCCQKHDCCYAHLKTQNCRTLTDNYQYNVSQGVVHCSDKGSWCEQQMCACDKEMALCLKQNLDSYNKSLRYYWKPYCGARPLHARESACLSPGIYPRPGHLKFEVLQAYDHPTPGPSHLDQLAFKALLGSRGLALTSLS